MVMTLFPLLLGVPAQFRGLVVWRVGEKCKADTCTSELEREKRWSRIHLVPLLLAEQDRDLYRREQAALAREKEIMSDVPGWEVSNASSSVPFVSASGEIVNFPH